jgi:DNA repair protein SbcC/Rad50
MPDELVLETLIIQNFRSIRGEVVVPVNAPVVLIHGPNGSGKSSLMTALAVALAGPRITAIAEPKHLVHHGADYAAITLGTSQGPKVLRIAPGDAGVGPGALDAKASAFFAERCYLEQTKLTRLLDLYQETSKGGAESALTQFVKELLSLDELDALVDGLEVAGHVRRVDRELETFGAWRAELPDLDDRVAKIEREQQASRDAIIELESSFRAGLSALDLADVGPDDAAVQRALEQREDVETLARLDTLALRLKGLARRRANLDGSESASTATDAEAWFAAARERLEGWQKAHGSALGAVITELRSEFPRLPSLETVSPSVVYDQALESVEAERSRLTKALANDDQTLAEHEQAQQAVAEARTRLKVLDRELADETAPGAFGELARVLADLAPHVASDTCPVCGRDFSEVSNEPLSAHLAAEISRLSARAGQLQSAARARLDTTTDLQRGEEAAARLLAQRLPAERRSAEQQRLATLTALAEQLREHERGAHEGGAIMRDVVAAEAALSEVLRRDRAHVQWREELEQLTTEVAAEVEIEGRVKGADDLLEPLERRIEQLRERQTQRADIGRLWDELRKHERAAQELASERAQVEARQARQSQAVIAVRQRMEHARALRHRVEEIRRSTITRVFNSALNKLWAELFVRLAPDEEYVPAFSEPSPTGPVEARLETRRRDGTPAGTPNEMLSAGNLNTAALTLFLALHLSVRRRVPWLLLDDPVQSMDEIHVAQFAALLRTLTQQEPQRRVFIAVHERALFEYLALELSPATPAGGLITVELRRERGGGDSTALPKSRSYEPDTALSAA